MIDLWDVNVQLQFWSGTWGAVLGSVLGAATAVLVLYKSNKKQTELAQAALLAQATSAESAAREQRTMFEAELTQNEANARSQMVLQRNELRAGREAEILSELLGCVASFMVTPQPSREIESTMYSMCDRLTVNLAGDVKDWHRSYLWEGGITLPGRGPANAFELYTRVIMAARRLGVPMQQAMNAAALERPDQWKVGSPNYVALVVPIGPAGAEMLTPVIEVLIAWPDLTSLEQREWCQRLVRQAESTAKQFIGRLDRCWTGDQDGGNSKVEPLLSGDEGADYRLLKLATRLGRLMPAQDVDGQVAKRRLWPSQWRSLSVNPQPLI